MSNTPKSLLRWAAMLLLVAAIGSLAVPGYFRLTWKLAVGALAMLVLWFVYPGGETR